MKKIILISTLISIFFEAHSQNFVYDSGGKKIEFKSEELEIDFTPSNVKFPKNPNKVAPGIIAAIPTVVDIGFRLTEKALEKKVKTYSAEYTKQKSNLDASLGNVPNFSFIHTYKTKKDGNPEQALKISFVASEVNGVSGFVYYVDNINLVKSLAKAKSDKNTFDYSIEIKPTFLVKGEKKVQELAPLVISSVEFENKNFTPLKHRTDIISLPEDGILTEISLKIIETNPAKVRAEKVLAFWNDNKDDAKTIINNFLPEQEKDNTQNPFNLDTLGTAPAIEDGEKKPEEKNKEKKLKVKNN